MLRILVLFFAIIVNVQVLCAQPVPVNREQFFLNDSTINVQLTTDIRALRLSKAKPKWQPAHVVFTMPDSQVIDENIRIEPRGVYRKQNCDLASLMLDFKTNSSPLLSGLKKLKLVGGCYSNASSEELLLEEYLVYKIYNILTPMSFRVRLLHVTYNDSRQKMKPYTQYAFLIEDIKDLAERNNCKEIKKTVFNTETTNHLSITFVSIFEFMIGNTDWSIPNYHNIKLMAPRGDSLVKPYVIPYDFDYSGVVNAPYAVPAENLDIKSVRERYYLGHERTMDELMPLVSTFKKDQTAIMKLVDNFNLLRQGSRKEISNYLDDFYEIIKNENGIRYAFIANAVH